MSSLFIWHHQHRQRPSPVQVQVVHCSRDGGTHLTITYLLAVCGKIYNGKSSFREHYLKCSKTTKHICTYENCTNIHFGSRRELRRHVEHVHLGVKNHVCEKCGKSFQNSGGLKVHIRQHHTGERPFVCITCGKDFAQKEVWKRHQQIHLDVKMFRCEYCGKTFAQEVTLMTHIRFGTNSFE